MENFEWVKEVLKSSTDPDEQIITSRLLEDLENANYMRPVYEELNKLNTDFNFLPEVEKWSSRDNSLSCIILSAASVERQDKKKIKKRLLDRKELREKIAKKAKELKALLLVENTHQDYDRSECELWSPGLFELDVLEPLQRETMRAIEILDEIERQLDYHPKIWSPMEEALLRSRKITILSDFLRVFKVMYSGDLSDELLKISAEVTLDIEPEPDAFRKALKRAGL